MAMVPTMSLYVPVAMVPLVGVVPPVGFHVPVGVVPTVVCVAMSMGALGQ